ncbi:uncharacterized protein PAC_01165 [Phialocephala subalpina]|uniref:Uncharacterized protein n=1 Tax=Phialocephala subalpina TaxID=576137 RepID=A0A1L7WET2_9HELO|nr:uncharacterized protein PAC_01165 [Phialocephala subalpina]
MDSGGDAPSVNSAPIVTTVDSSTAITSSVNHGASSSSSPTPVFDEKKPDTPELAGTSIVPLNEFEARLARLEALLTKASEPDPRIARLEAALSRSDVGRCEGNQGDEYWRLTCTMDFKIPNVDINIDGYFSVVITSISKHAKPLGVSNILLTILGFVVGLSLSFRGSTAYERSQNMDNIDCPEPKSGEVHLGSCSGARWRVGQRRPDGQDHRNQSHSRSRCLSQAPNFDSSPIHTIPTYGPRWPSRYVRQICGARRTTRSQTADQ